MAKQKRTASSNEDPSFDSELSSSGKRLKASSWKEAELNDIGIFFSQKPLSVIELIDKLKKLEKGVKTRGPIPASIDSFKKYTKRLLNFSFMDINWSQKSTLPLAMKLQEDEKEEESLTVIGTANRNMTEFYEEMRSGKNVDPTLTLNDRLSNRLFEHWYCSVFLFVTEIKEVLEQLIHPIQVPPGVPQELADKDILKESVFTHMFMKFTQICFLNSEVGDRRKISLKIRNKVVGCVPDVRFYQHETRAKSPHLLVMLAEVKKDTLNQTDDDDPSEDSKTPLIQKYLNKSVLGQIGVELMSECWNSAFAPCSLGIVCMRTEIIFMLLDTNLKHYDTWTKNKVSENLKSYIQYTKSYDIMKAEDRSEIMDLLFWLGCVQKGDFEHYFFFGQE